ncbi:hypothetical protein L6R29_14820 [Myxococcota bacterium]|nr:hypothetical protein [Myxococcota bacterium]
MVKKDIARFLKNHVLGEREAVLADIERYRGRSLEELGRELTVVCRVAAEVLEASPEKERILDFREPADQSYFRFLRSMKRKQRHEGGEDLVA